MSTVEAATADEFEDEANVAIEDAELYNTNVQ